MSGNHPGPIAPRHSTIADYHHHRREDHYAWLRADNWREAMQDPGLLPTEIRDYLEAENRHAESVMAPTAALRQRLFDELKARLKEDDSSVPAPDGPWEYYTRYRVGGQQPVFCRRPRGATDGEQVLLDGDAEAEGQAYFRIINAAHSRDHRLLAYAVDRSGAEVCTILVRDLETGDLLQSVVEQARGDLVWAAESATLFYTVIDDDHRPRWVRRRHYPDGDDALVYEEADPGFFVGVDETESGRHILIDSHDHITSEVRVIPADRPATPPRVLLQRRTGVEYEVTDHGDHWVMLTNADGAEDFTIVRRPLDNPAAVGDTLVPHRRGCLIQDLIVFRDYMVRLELEDGLPRIVVRRWADGEEHAVGFSEEGYSLGMQSGYEFDSCSLRFGYSSFATPGRVYDYDMESRDRVLRKEQEVPSGHDPAAYVSHRLMATAADGEQVPVSLFHRRDLQPGPNTPLLLYGYGSYGMIDLPSFAPNRLSLVDRGFVFAIAHVRGGKEKGDHWYRQGKLEHKPNTFSDFIAAAEALIAEGYTGPGRIAAHGGSAGGMLVGAVVNQRPELFHAAVADVPFVDVLNTMLDPSLPLTPPEWPEWGNPIESESAYRTILSYSPYDNVRAQAYPNLLVTAGVSDPRVTYWEPAKWVARLRELKTDDNLLLLKTNMSAGHGGASGRFDYLEEVAYRYAFLLLVYGLAE
ncbi:oligopeptidase B [Natronocella acetinitrilica]|uniref:Oligopeptidase B n=1 Tax=Natronocella acetinitrilica TaxID=414046 RepID=A0AAE3G458_9GAMM|nr:oligopeptidase B [Natronocella acetinitrilica]